MTDTDPRLNLAARRAVTRLILAGYLNDDAGWSTAIGDLLQALGKGQIDTAGILDQARWSLPRLPRSFDAPSALTDWLAATYTAEAQAIGLHGHDDRGCAGSDG